MYQRPFVLSTRNKPARKGDLGAKASLEPELMGQIAISLMAPICFDFVDASHDLYPGFECSGTSCSILCSDFLASLSEHTQCLAVSARSP